MCGFGSGGRRERQGSGEPVDRLCPRPAAGVSAGLDRQVV